MRMDTPHIVPKERTGCVSRASGTIFEDLRRQWPEFRYERDQFRGVSMNSCEGYNGYRKYWFSFWWRFKYSFLQNRRSVAQNHISIHIYRSPSVLSKSICIIYNGGKRKTFTSLPSVCSPSPFPLRQKHTDILLTISCYLWFEEDVL